MQSGRPDQVGTDADCRATDSKLPEDWICHNPSDVCISLMHSKAAYCCPKGHDCNRVPPVPYIRIDGPPQFHRVLIVPDDTRFFVRNTTWNAEECGTGGCPVGYTCSQRPQADVPEPICKILGKYATTPNKDSASLANLTHKATETMSAEPLLPTATKNISDAMNAGASPESSTLQNHEGTHANAVVIAGATIGAAVGIVAIVLAVMIYLRYVRKTVSKEEDGDKESESEGSHEMGYWSFDGRRDAAGRLSRKWSDSTLR